MPAGCIYIHKKCGYRAERLVKRLMSSRSNNRRNLILVPWFLCTYCNVINISRPPIPESETAVVYLGQEERGLYNYGTKTSQRFVLAT